MPVDSVMGDLEYFYDELPADVRRDLSFMLVSLTDETMVEYDQDHEAAVRALFAAQTCIGRLSDLITVAAIFDVYFAMDARRRFDPGKGTRLDAHARRIDAIEAAGRDWARLRSTALSPAAIAREISLEATSRRHAG